MQQKNNGEIWTGYGKAKKNGSYKQCKLKDTDTPFVIRQISKDQKSS